MQKIGAYLLERTEGMNWPDARTNEIARIREIINKWLIGKGAASGSTSGKYKAEDGSEASFTIDQASHGHKTWWMARLQEVDKNDRRFVMAISVTGTDQKVVVYASLEVGHDETSIRTVEVDARCPKVIRTLIDSATPWFHGASRIQRLREVQGFDAGEGIVAEIKAPNRTVPLVVVTSDAFGVAIPELHKSLEYDLAGIANVVLTDAEASWALTDGLGAELSCHSGSVRVYWPKFSLKDDPFRHALWTRKRLSGAGDVVQVRERFRRQLRSLVMRAAALGVVRPKEIDVIRASASSQAFTEMKDKATSLEDFVALADSYSKENFELRNSTESLRGTLLEMQERVASLEAERSVLLLRVENAEVQLRYRRPVEDDIAPDSAPVSVPKWTAPKDGEYRFYKKLYAAPSHDVMQVVGDCGCDSWEGAHAADKARKGIAKLEEGRTDWQKMQHCAKCTGGGMWRVKW